MFVLVTLPSRDVTYLSIAVLDRRPPRTHGVRRGVARVCGVHHGPSVWVPWKRGALVLFRAHILLVPDPTAEVHGGGRWEPSHDR